MVNLFLQLIVAFGLAWDTQKNRMFEVGRDLKDNLIPRLLPKAGHLTLSHNQRITEPKITEPFFTHLLDQLSQGPIPGLWASFYSLSLSISYLFIHTSLLVSLSSFFLLGSVAPGVYPMTLYQADPWRKRPKSLIPESKTSCVSSLCWHLLDCLQPAYLSCIRGKAVLSLRQTPACLKSPVKVLWMWGCCPVSGKAPSHSAFLAGQPGADPILKPPDPARPSILIRELLVHPQVKLCVLQLLSGRGCFPLLISLPVLPTAHILPHPSFPQSSLGSHFITSP